MLQQCNCQFAAGQCKQEVLTSNLPPYGLHTHFTPLLQSAASLDASHLADLQSNCYSFQLSNITGLNGMQLPTDPSVMRDTINTLYTTPANCSATS